MVEMWNRDVGAAGKEHLALWGGGKEGAVKEGLRAKLVFERADS